MIIFDRTVYGLLATEPEVLFKPRKFSILKEAVVGKRDDFICAEVDTPFQPLTLWLEQKLELEYVLLASRHCGNSLRRLEVLPIDVYICGVKNQELALSDNIDSEQVYILAWALMLAPDDNRESLKEIYESIKQTRGNVNYINPVNL